MSFFSPLNAISFPLYTFDSSSLTVPSACGCVIAAMSLLALSRRDWISTTAVLFSLSVELKQPRILPFRTLHRLPPVFRIPSFSSSRVSPPVLAVSSDVLHDAGATAAVLVGAYSLVRGFDNLTRRNLIQQVRRQSHILFLDCICNLFW